MFYPSASPATQPPPVTTQPTSEQCPIDMSQATHLPADMFQISPSNEDTPEARQALTLTSATPLTLPADVHPSITISFPVDTESDYGTPFSKFSFVEDSNIKSYTISIQNAATKEWEILRPAGLATEFSGNEPAEFQPPIKAHKVKITPTTATDNSGEYRMKPKIHACLKKTTTATAATTTIISTTGTLQLPFYSFKQGASLLILCLMYAT